MTNAPVVRPDVEEKVMDDRPRLMPVVIDGSALVVRPEPATASGTPLNHAEKTLNAMADRIEALEARQVKLEAVVAELQHCGITFMLKPESGLSKALADLGEGDGWTGPS